MANKKYRCIKTFGMIRFTENGWDEKRPFTVEEGSIWEEIEGVSILGGEVHLENKKTLGWLELPRKALGELFEPVAEE